MVSPSSSSYWIHVTFKFPRCRPVHPSRFCFEGVSLISFWFSHLIKKINSTAVWVQQSRVSGLVYCWNTCLLFCFLHISRRFRSAKAACVVCVLNINGGGTPPLRRRASPALRRSEPGHRSLPAEPSCAATNRVTFALFMFTTTRCKWRGRGGDLHHKILFCWSVKAEGCYLVTLLPMPHQVPVSSEDSL